MENNCYKRYVIAVEMYVKCDCVRGCNVTTTEYQVTLTLRYWITLAEGKTFGNKNLKDKNDYLDLQI